MKTRNGFVSNSSSSSFIVIRKDFMDRKKQFLITPKEEKLLVKYGFKKVSCYYANQIPDEIYMIRKSPTKEYLKMLKRMKIKLPGKKQKNPYFNYGYDITCNQDDVLYFLLKNNIAFEASIHYEHETVVYKKNAKYFLRVQNFGNQFNMSNWRKDYDEMCEDWNKQQIITKVNVKEWLKKEEKWYKEFKEKENNEKI